MRKALLIIAAVPWVVAAAEPETQAPPVDIETILSEPLPDEEYVETERCLSTFRYHSVEVLSPRYLVFEGTGDRVWLNKLRRSCPGLRDNLVLRFETRSRRLCSLDLFEGLTDTGFGFMEIAHCSLGEFQSVTEAQVELLRDALDQARNTPRSDEGAEPPEEEAQEGNR